LFADYEIHLLFSVQEIESLSSLVSSDAKAKPLLSYGL
jgi:hypothetical protein